ncbi:uncharacterized protein LOC108098486 [Drosophila ficusphila]|uniref:uncharacterized protein LOC108098486 n=1 Tax=Drosophila ficusphila TaxID=30025 RepID=UPI0007E6EBE3|nr:uncharacterized protein LOC108098486 [Drosophila ficusphila]
MWQLALGLGLIQQLSLAIIVERNMFAYYKVPATQLLYSQDSDLDFDSQSQEITSFGESQVNDLYYVLQCPPKLNEAIPKPQDMQTCSVVDQYRGMWKKKKPKPKKRYHMIPFRIVLRPLGPPAKRRSLKRRKRQHKDHKYTNIKASYDRNPLKVKKEEVVSPLQYLGLPHKRQKLLKLSADHRKFKRGSSSKGHHHMYHRDESYNDHIFYDELEDDGKYHKLGKEKLN